MTNRGRQAPANTPEQRRRNKITTPTEAKSFVENVYDSLSKPAEFAALLSDDISFHVVRSTPETVINGKAALVEYFARVGQVAPMDGDIQLEQFAENAGFAFSLHVEAEGTPREHRHLMVWRIEAGVVEEAWELPFGGPPSLQGVDIAAMEALGYQTIVLEPRT